MITAITRRVAPASPFAGRNPLVSSETPPAVTAGGTWLGPYGGRRAALRARTEIAGADRARPRRRRSQVRVHGPFRRPPAQGAPQAAAGHRTRRRRPRRPGRRCRRAVVAARRLRLPGDVRRRADPRRPELQERHRRPRGRLRPRRRRPPGPRPQGPRPPPAAEDPVRGGPPAAATTSSPSEHPPRPPSSGTAAVRVRAPSP